MLKYIREVFQLIWREKGENSRDIKRLKKNYNMLMKQFVNPKLYLPPNQNILEQLKCLDFQKKQEMLSSFMTNSFIGKRNYSRKLPALPKNSSKEELKSAISEHLSLGWSGQPTDKNALNPMIETSSYPEDITSAFFVFPEMEQVPSTKIKNSKRKLKSMFKKSSKKKNNKHLSSSVNITRIKKPLRSVKKVRKSHMRTFDEINIQKKEEKGTEHKNTSEKSEDLQIALPADTSKVKRNENPDILVHSNPINIKKGDNFDQSAQSINLVNDIQKTSTVNFKYKEQLNNVSSQTVDPKLDITNQTITKDDENKFMMAHIFSGINNVQDFEAKDQTDSLMENSGKTLSATNNEVTSLDKNNELYDKHTYSSNKVHSKGENVIKVRYNNLFDNNNAYSKQQNKKSHKILKFREKVLNSLNLNQKSDNFKTTNNNESISKTNLSKFVNKISDKESQANQRVNTQNTQNIIKVNSPKHHQSSLISSANNTTYNITKTENTGHLGKSTQSVILNENLPNMQNSDIEKYDIEKNNMAKNSFFKKQDIKSNTIKKVSLNNINTSKEITNKHKNIHSQNELNNINKANPSIKDLHKTGSVDHKINDTIKDQGTYIKNGINSLVHINTPSIATNNNTTTNSKSDSSQLKTKAKSTIISATKLYTPHVRNKNTYWILSAKSSLIDNTYGVSQIENLKGNTNSSNKGEMPNVFIPPTEIVKPENKNVKDLNILSRSNTKNTNNDKNVVKGTTTVIQSDYLKFVENKAWYYDHYRIPTVKSGPEIVSDKSQKKQKEKDIFKHDLINNKQNKVDFITSKSTSDLIGKTYKNLKTKIAKGDKISKILKKKIPKKPSLKTTNTLIHLKRSKQDKLLTTGAIKEKKQNIFIGEINTTNTNSKNKSLVTNSNKNPQQSEKVRQTHLPTRYNSSSPVLVNKTNSNIKNQSNNQTTVINQTNSLSQSDRKSSNYLLALNHKSKKGLGFRKPVTRIIKNLPDTAEIKYGIIGNINNASGKKIKYKLLENQKKSVHKKYQPDTFDKTRLTNKEKKLNSVSRKIVENKVNSDSVVEDMSKKRFRGSKMTGLNSNKTRKLHSKKVPAKTVNLKMYGERKGDPVADSNSLKYVQIARKVNKNKETHNIHSNMLVNKSFKRDSTQANSTRPMKLQRRYLFTIEHKANMMINYLWKRYVSTVSIQNKTKDSSIACSENNFHHAKTTSLLINKSKNNEYLIGKRHINKTRFKGGKLQLDKNKIKCAKNTSLINMGSITNTKRIKTNNKNYRNSTTYFNTPDKLKENTVPIHSPSPMKQDHRIEVLYCRTKIKDNQQVSENFNNKNEGEINKKEVKNNPKTVMQSEFNMVHSNSKISTLSNDNKLSINAKSNVHNTIKKPLSIQEKCPEIYSKSLQNNPTTTLDRNFNINHASSFSKEFDKVENVKQKYFINIVNNKKSDNFKHEHQNKSAVPISGTKISKFSHIKPTKCNKNLLGIEKFVKLSNVNGSLSIYREITPGQTLKWKSKEDRKNYLALSIKELNSVKNNDKKTTCIKCNVVQNNQPTVIPETCGDKSIPKKPINEIFGPLMNKTLKNTTIPLNQKSSEKKLTHMYKNEHNLKPLMAQSKECGLKNNTHLQVEGYISKQKSSGDGNDKTLIQHLPERNIISKIMTTNSLGINQNTTLQCNTNETAVQKCSDKDSLLQKTKPSVPKVPLYITGISNVKKSLDLTNKITIKQSNSFNTNLNKRIAFNNSDLYENKRDKLRNPEESCGSRSPLVALAKSSEPYKNAVLKKQVSCKSETEIGEYKSGNRPANNRPTSFQRSISELHRIKLLKAKFPSLKLNQIKEPDTKNSYCKDKFVSTPSIIESSQFKLPQPKDSHSVNNTISKFPNSDAKIIKKSDVKNSNHVKNISQRAINTESSKPKKTLSKDNCTVNSTISKLPRSDLSPIKFSNTQHVKNVYARPAQSESHKLKYPDIKPLKYTNTNNIISEIPVKKELGVCISEKTLGKNVRLSKDTNTHKSSNTHHDSRMTSLNLTKSNEIPQVDIKSKNIIKMNSENQTAPNISEDKSYRVLKPTSAETNFNSFSLTHSEIKRLKSKVKTDNFKGLTENQAIVKNEQAILKLVQSKMPDSKNSCPVNSTISKLASSDISQIKLDNYTQRMTNEVTKPLNSESKKFKPLDIQPSKYINRKSKISETPDKKQLGVCFSEKTLSQNTLFSKDTDCNIHKDTNTHHEGCMRSLKLTKSIETIPQGDIQSKNIVKINSENQKKLNISETKSYRDLKPTSAQTNLNIAPLTHSEIKRRKSKVKTDNFKTLTENQKIIKNEHNTSKVIQSKMPESKVSSAVNSIFSKLSNSDLSQIKLANYTQSMKNIAAKTPNSESNKFKHLDIQPSKYINRESKKTETPDKEKLNVCFSEKTLSQNALFSKDTDCNLHKNNNIHNKGRMRSLNLTKSSETIPQGDIKSKNIVKINSENQTTLSMSEDKSYRALKYATAQTNFNSVSLTNSEIKRLISNVKTDNFKSLTENQPIVKDLQATSKVIKSKMPDSKDSCPVNSTISKLSSSDLSQNKLNNYTQSTKNVATKPLNSESNKFKHLDIKSSKNVNRDSKILETPYKKKFGVCFSDKNLSQNAHFYKDTDCNLYKSSNTHHEGHMRSLKFSKSTETIPQGDSKSKNIVKNNSENPTTMNISENESHRILKPHSPQQNVKHFLLTHSDIKRLESNVKINNSKIYTENHPIEKEQANLKIVQHEMADSKGSCPVNNTISKLSRSDLSQIKFPHTTKLINHTQPMKNVTPKLSIPESNKFKHLDIKKSKYTNKNSKISETPVKRESGVRISEKSIGEKVCLSKDCNTYKNTNRDLTKGLLKSESKNLVKTNSTNQTTHNNSKDKLYQVLKPSSAQTDLKNCSLTHSEIKRLEDKIKINHFKFFTENQSNENEQLTSKIVHQKHKEPIKQKTHPIQKENYDSEFSLKKHFAQQKVSAKQSNQSVNDLYSSSYLI